MKRRLLAAASAIALLTFGATPALAEAAGPATEEVEASEGAPTEGEVAAEPAPEPAAQPAPETVTVEPAPAPAPAPVAAAPAPEPAPAPATPADPPVAALVSLEEPAAPTSADPPAPAETTHEAASAPPGEAADTGPPGQEEAAQTEADAAAPAEAPAPTADPAAAPSEESAAVPAPRSMARLADAPGGTISEVYVTQCALWVQMDITAAGEYVLTVATSDGTSLAEAYSFEASSTGPQSATWRHLVQSTTPGTYQITLSSIEDDTLATLDETAWTLTSAVKQECTAAVDARLQLVDSDGTVSPGEDLTIRGSGFWGPEEVDITLNGSAVASFSSGATGSYEGTITIPSDTPLGTATLSASGPRSGAQASLTLRIVSSEPDATLSMLPAEDYVVQGLEVRLVGTGFGADETVTLALDGTALGSATADSAGDFAADVTIPADASLGVATITATGATSARTASLDTEVKPQVTERPDAFFGDITRDGCQVSVPVETIGALTWVLEVIDDEIVLDTYSWTTTENGTHTVVWTITAPALTAVPGVGFFVSGEAYDGSLVPIASYDPYEFPAEVANGCSAQVPVDATLDGYDGEPVAPGTGLAVSGEGFWPGETVSAVFRSDPVEVGTFVADEDGAFVGEFAIPADAEPGLHHLVLTGQTSGRSISLPITVGEEGEPPPVGGYGASIVSAVVDECSVVIEVATFGGAGDWLFQAMDQETGLAVWSHEWTTTEESATARFTWALNAAELDGVSTIDLVVYALTGDEAIELDLFQSWVTDAEGLVEGCEGVVPDAAITLPGYDGEPVAPGSSLVVEGTGFGSEETVEVVFDPAGLPVPSLLPGLRAATQTAWTFPTDEDGSFTGTITVPDDAAEGPHTVAATGLTSGLTGTAEVLVAGEEEPPPVVAPSATIGEITLERCDVSIPVTTTGAGDWILDVWDDGELIDSYEWTTTTDGTHTVVWTITAPALSDAVGVGFYVSYVDADGFEHGMTAVDPWEYPDELASECSSVVPVTLELPGYDGTAVDPGTELKVVGKGYWPGETVSLTFGPKDIPVGTYEADETGSFSGTFTVPLDAASGTQLVNGYGETSGRLGTATVLVAGETPPPVVEPTAVIGEITRNGCDVLIPVTTTGAGDWVLEVWDDGKVIDSYEWTTTSDGTRTVTWKITRPALDLAPGVGFVVSFVVDGEHTILDVVDPWEYPASVAAECSGTTPPVPGPGPGPGSGSGGGLPSTGANVASAGLLALGLLAIGGATLVGRKRFVREE